MASSQHAGKAIVPAQPSSYGGSGTPPTPPVATGSGKPGPKPTNVHPQPIGPSKPLNEYDAAYQAAHQDAQSRGPEKGPKWFGKSGVFPTMSTPNVILIILFTVLLYDILTSWKQATQIEDAGFGAATYLTRTLEGGASGNAAGNQSATRPGRQAGT